FALERWASGEVRLILTTCRAAAGPVGNLEHEHSRIGKAGRSRWLGKRPTVRGSAMNPNDRPRGGGEGRTPIGRPSPVSPWGKPTNRKITRPVNKHSNKYIVRERKK